MNIYRKYRYGDARLIEIANVFARHFLNHQEALAKTDPNLTPVWLQSVMAPIEQVTLDDFEQSAITSLTEEVVSGMENCHRLFGLTKYFVELAFKDQRNIERLFGHKKYPYRKASQEKYIMWLQTYVEKVEAHREALLAANTPETLLSDFAAAVDKLDKDNKKQEFTKDDRSGHTIERIEILNGLYEALRRLEKVAGYTFAPGSKEQEFFTLPVMSRPPLREIQGEESTDDVPPTDSSGDAPPDAAPGNDGEAAE